MPKTRKFKFENDIITCNYYDADNITISVPPDAVDKLREMYMTVGCSSMADLTFGEFVLKVLNIESVDNFDSNGYTTGTQAVDGGT